jgi:hypothetical protein
VWAEIAAFVAGIAAGGRSEAGAAFVAGRRGIAADARESRRWAVGRRDARLGIMAEWGRAGGRASGYSATVVCRAAGSSAG